MAGENDASDGIDSTNEWHRAAPDPSKREFAYDWAHDFVAPFLPTAEAVVHRSLDVVRLGPHDRLVDLGCGDGRFVIEAARRGAELAVGYELDPALCARARAAAAAAAVQNPPQFVDADFLSELVDTAGGLERFTVVVCYLFPAVVSRMRPRLQAWLEGSTERRLVCVRWPIDEYDAAWNARFLAEWLLPPCDAAKGFAHLGFFVYAQRSTIPLQ